jgi:catecholate siderophore receptor
MWSKFNMKKGSLVLVWLILELISVYGQSKCFRGKVRDVDNLLIVGAEIRLKQTSGNTIERTISDNSGEFSLSCVENGEYVLTISKAGMSPIEKKINLKKNSNETTEVVLTASEISESVTINIESEFANSTSETATKTSLPLRDIPQSVEVVNRQVLDSQAVLTLKDALTNVTAVSVAQGEGRRDQFFIRGFSAIGDQFIDGVRDDALYYRDLSNIEQIEVVKGPSAVLFGRGSSGGIINRTTKKPNVFGRIGSAETNFGSYGLKRGSVDFGKPIVKEKLAFRLVAAAEKAGSFRQFYKQNRYNFAPSLAWKPSEKTDVTFQFEYLNDERTPDRGIPSFRGRPLNVPISNNYGYPKLDKIRNRVSSQALRIEHLFNQNWTVRNVFRRIGTATDFYNTSPEGVCLLNAVGTSCSTIIASSISETDSSLRVTRRQYSGRIRQTNYFNQSEILGFVNTFGVTHNILAGIEVGSQSRKTYSLRNSTASPVAFLNPILTQPINNGFPTTNNKFNANVFGIYLQDQISINKNWKALIGVRYDSFEQKVDDLLATNVDLTRTDKQFSPRFGLVYQPNDWLSFYGSYSRSFQPSGENLSLAANNTELKPELTRNYETGVKATIKPLRLNTTLSVFSLNRNNIKTTDPLNPAKLILVGEQRTNGIEFTVSGSPIRKLDFLAGYALLDAEIIKSNTVSNGVLLQGKLAQLTPRNSGNLWLNYQLPEGFRLGFGGIARSNSFTSTNNLVKLAGYARLDSSIGWKSERHYEISFNFKNILNRVYFESSNGDNNILPGSPINGSVTMRYRW